MKNITPITTLFLSAPLLFAQEPSQPTLEAARLAQEVEHDLDRALGLFQAVAEDATRPDLVRREAHLAAGKLLKRMGQSKQAQRALQAAAKGNDAVAQEAKAELAQKAPDVEREGQLREQALAAIEQLDQAFLKPGGVDSKPVGLKSRQGIWREPSNDLIWLGSAAFPVLKARINDCLEWRQEHSESQGALRFRTHPASELASAASRLKQSQANLLESNYIKSLTAIMWSLDSDESRSYIAAKLKDGTQQEKVAFAGGLAICTPLSEESMGLAIRLMQDSEGSGPASLLALEAGGQKSPQRGSRLLVSLNSLDVRDLIDSGIPAIQEHGIQMAIGSLGSRGRPVTEEQITGRTLADALADACRSTHPVVSRLATEELVRGGGQSIELRIALLQNLHAIPHSQRARSYINVDSGGGRIVPLPNRASGSDARILLNHFNSENGAELALKDQEAEAFMAALKAYPLGASSSSGAGAVLKRLCILFSAQAGPESIDTILLAASQGYLTLDRLQKWVVMHCDAGHVPQLLKAVSAHPNWTPLLYCLVPDAVPEQALPLLGTLLERYEAQPDRKSEFLACFRLLGGVETVEAGRMALSHFGPGHYPQLVQTLLTVDEKHPSRETLELLHNALVLPLEEESKAGGETRARIMARLVWRSDPWVLEHPEFWAPQNIASPAKAVGGVRVKRDNEGIPGLWLLVGSSSRTKGWEPIARFDSPALLEFVRRTMRDPDLVELLGWHETHNWNSLVEARFFDHREEVLGLLTELWTQRIQTSQGLLPDREWMSLDGVCEMLGRHFENQRVDANRLSEMRARLAKVLLKSEVGPTWESATQLMFPSTVNPFVENWLKPESIGWFNDNLPGYLSDWGVHLNREQWSRLASSEDEGTRRKALVNMRSITREAQASWIAPLAQDSSSKVRIEVCKQLQGMLDPQATQILLTMLGDPASSVQTAARNALDHLRFYHQETERWKRFFENGTMDGQSAAERLIGQAGAKHPLAQRVMAIRSLGKLAEPQTLPLLIEWSAAEESKIAEAAKAAIESILAKE